MKADKIGQIERLAIEVTRACGAAVPPEKPIDLRKLSKHIGVRRIAAVDMVSDGRLDRQPEGPSVYYRYGIRGGRRRFTIAHELGHLLLGNSDVFNGLEFDEIERLCNAFAAELLMPRRWIYTFSNLDRRLDTVRTVAKQADVSIAAAFARLRNEAQWQESALFLHKRETWSLESTVGSSRFSRHRLEATAMTAQVLDDLHARRVEDARCKLPVRVDRRRAELAAEVSVHGRKAIALVGIR